MGNDPVNNVDPDGGFIFNAMAMVMGGVGGFVAGGIIAFANDGDIIKGALLGAAGGVAAGMLGGNLSGGQATSFAVSAGPAVAANLGAQAVTGSGMGRGGGDLNFGQSGGGGNTSHSNFYLTDKNESLRKIAEDDIKSILPCNDEVQGRLSFDKNGRVNFNTEGLQSDDPGVELLTNLTTAKENYGYSVDDNVTEYQQKYSSDERPIGERDRPSKVKVPKNGIINNSMFPLFDIVADGSQHFGTVPEPGYDGHLNVSSTIKVREFQNKKVVKPRPSIVFHELWENFEKTTNHQFRNGVDPGPAHNRAVDAEKRFHPGDHRLSLNPGFGYP